MATNPKPRNRGDQNVRLHQPDVSEGPSHPDVLGNQPGTKRHLVAFPVDPSHELLRKRLGSSLDDRATSLDPPAEDSYVGAGEPPACLDFHQPPGADLPSQPRFTKTAIVSSNSLSRFFFIRFSSWIIGTLAALVSHFRSKKCERTEPTTDKPIATPLIECGLTSIGDISGFSPPVFRWSQRGLCSTLGEVLHRWPLRTLHPSP